MSNLSKTIAAVSLLVPASAYSLGIGDIQLHSALNQNLDAEIGLLVSEDENVSDIKVRLASPDKFEEAGVPWNYFLSKIKFKPVTLPDGSTIVKLSSNEAFREPFLDFLLEVSWAKGSLYREFTVLLDPPVAYTQPVIPVIKKAQQVAKIEKKAPKVVAPSPVPSVVKEAATKTFQGQEYTSFETAIDKYGPTKRNESVWNIAKKTNAFSDVSREQMMMALYNANPQAFSKKNINSLLVGKTLDIPARNDILNLSRKEATRAFKKQADEWAGYVVSKQSTADSKKQSSQSVKSQLDLKAPTEAQIAALDNVVSKGGSTLDQGVDNIAGVVSQEARKKIDKLEQQLSDMQKMLDLKNEQIAALQNKSLVKQANIGEVSNRVEVDKETSKPEITPVNKDPIKVTEVDPKKVIPGKVADKGQPKTEIKPEIKPVAEVKTKAESDEGGLWSAEMLAAIGIPVLGLLGWFFWRKRKADNELDTESMFASATEISLPKDNEDELFASSQEDVSSFYETIDVDNSLLSEFASSDLSTFDTEQTEVDPILEADVYLAYGRYQQAEELMREAIVDQPDRDECKLKLLEILHANENMEAYEAYAAELMDSGKQNDTVFWDKVVDMGVELNPESEFFAQDIGSKATFEIDDTDRDSSPLENEVLTDSLFSESSEEDAQDELKEENAEDVVENEMEFDLSIFDEDEVGQDKKTTEVLEENGLDFDLDEFDLDKASGNQVTGSEEISDLALEAENLESSEFDFDSIMADESSSKEDQENEFKDFDFDSSAIDKKPSKVSDIELDNIELANIELNEETETVQSIESLDFSLDDNVSSEEAMLALESSKQETEKFNLFDFDEDVDSSSSDLGLENEIELSDISDLDSMDEIETKVDLAKAYIDMGDYDSAKDIAEEILLKGNENQQKSAQSIIDLVVKV